MNDEINIKELPTEELLELMQEDLYDGLGDEIVAETEELLARGLQPYEILTRGLIAGMGVVGDDFRDGVLFVPEVLMAAKAMKAGMEVLRPLLTETGVEKTGTVVLGTVKGDIHDIGKNLVGMMLEGAGFEVVDLGTNTSAEDFLAAIQEHDADILGMSALLTTTMTYMRVVIEALKEANLRDKVVVLVGGAPLNEAFAEDIEADAYCRDAAIAVETAKKFMAIKRQGSGIGN
ncbi:MAG: cobalamin-binding protein [Anaerolineae bacterium]|nr:MAG: cobalamin-binding protein [Anaerolineae bacterium]